MSVEELSPPEEFYKIICDFTADIVTTFPEYQGIISRWWSPDGSKEEQTRSVFSHCLRVYPERFFDILYKNVDIFLPNSEINTEFLPGIVFKHLWSLDITDSTRETIWKYLQLILIAVIGNVNNSADLGDTAKLFEAIDEEELRNKLEETFSNVQNMFDGSNNLNEDFINEMAQEGNAGGAQMPSVEELQNHINSMMNGKIGKLASELAEETARDLDLDLDDVRTNKDVFQRLFKNPTKLMNMVKNIGTKIDEKIKSGELKQSELISEGMDLLNKMKSMPGMGNMQQLFSQMGMPNMGGKVNMGAMEAQMNRNLRMAKMRERMKSKHDAKYSQNASESSQIPSGAPLTDEQLFQIFSSGDKPERTPRGAKPPAPTGDKKKKNKGKK